MAADNVYHDLPGMKRFEDFLVCDIFPEEKILQVRDMQLESTDVVIASYPKTGTTLLQEIVYLIRNGADLEEANKTINVQRIPFMELGYKDNFEVFNKLSHPRHMKTHLPYRFLPKNAQEGYAKIVYIIRNPKDTLVSYYHFYRMNKAYNYFKGTWDDYFNYFMANNAMVGYGNPMDHFKGFWKHKDDANLHIVLYENLIKEPARYIAEIAKFLDCSLSEEQLTRVVDATSFDTMKQNPMTNMGSGKGLTLDHTISPFMRKGVVGDWKNYFNEEQNAIIDEMVKVRLEGSDIQFIYE